MIALCETARGVIAAADVAASRTSRRSCGAPKTSSRRSAAPRAASPTAAIATSRGTPGPRCCSRRRAHDIAAIDTVHLEIGDLDGLRAEAEDAAALGFAATACIHPSQVAVVREAYRPDRRTARVGPRRARGRGDRGRRVRVPRRDGRRAGAAPGRGARASRRVRPSRHPLAPRDIAPAEHEDRRNDSVTVRPCSGVQCGRAPRCAYSRFQSWGGGAEWHDDTVSGARGERGRGDVRATRPGGDPGHARRRHRAHRVRHRRTARRDDHVEPALRPDHGARRARSATPASRRTRSHSAPPRSDGPSTARRRSTVLDCYAGTGGSIIDTADSYAAGRSEIDHR